MLSIRSTLVATIAAIATLAADDAIAQPAALDRAAWLAGCWAREGKAEPGTVEQWMAPVGGVMLGMARTVRGGKVVEHEFLDIRADADGRLQYTASPSGQSRATFALLSQTDAEVVFENAAHDFPQRIIYRRHADGRLLARIEGVVKGQARGIDFPMRRMACDGPGVSSSTQTGAIQMHKVSGEFEVKMLPQAQEGAAGGPGRMLLDKRYRGPLEATSLGQMLAFGTTVPGSAGYVALEQVTGLLAGRRGSFALQHSGTMDRGAPTLSVTVVPDSGTDELKGLSGRMGIRIEGGKHYYDFEFQLDTSR